MLQANNVEDESLSLQDSAAMQAGRESWQGAQTAHLPSMVDLIKIATTEPKRREWFVQDLIPRGVNVLLSGHGGINKSTLARTVAVCSAAGVPCLGQSTTRVGVVLLSCEDDVDELHRSLRKLCSALGVDLESLRGRLFIFDATGRDAALYGKRTVAADGSVLYQAQPDKTELFDWFKGQVHQSGAELVILDSISDVYDESEIDRRQVRRYMTTCLDLVREFRGSVLHVGHIDKSAARFGPAAASGQTYSGSTAWNNSVRVRLSMTRPDDGEGNRSDDDGRRLLTVEKTNYGKPGLVIPLRFDPVAGVLVLDGAGQAEAGMVGVIRDVTERKNIIRLLLECEGMSRNVSTSERAHNNAYVILSEFPNFPKALKPAPGKRRLWGHLRRLQADKLIDAEVFTTTQRKPAERWRVTAAGKQEVAQ